ncbi:MAG TPA: 2-amino-4-hydroxy-6-hydroxymethyldihydropteridine diphosphokinase [Steroidobacteraceae bacterium]|nr:2-amino-4-hydroxy-6-hydroxymethyldihydropteridine diphosphokinase [Steroidobacteraceae bacterium]
MPQVYVAAGSNVEPQRHLQQAVAELEREFSGVRLSSWYRNRAAGVEGDDFINLVAGFSTSLPAHAVLERLHAIEARCGRTRHTPRREACSMDLDLLLYGDLVCEQPGLKLPRPELLERAYMLGPLAELAPQLLHPTAGVTVDELWRRFDQGAHPLERLARSRGQGG